MPVTNGVAWLRRSLDALLAQDYPHLEILIAESRSTDATASICAEYAARHPSIRFRSEAQDLGELRILQQLLREARGRYAFWARAYDFWQPQFVSRLVAELEGTPSAVAALPSVRRVRRNREIDRIRLLGDRSAAGGYASLARSLLTKRDARGAAVKNKVWIHGLVRTEAFRAALAAHPGVPGTLRHIVVQWALAGPLLYVDEPLLEKTMTAEPGEVDVAPPTSLKSAAALTWSLLRSPIVPLARKWQAFALLPTILAQPARAGLYRFAAATLPPFLLRAINGMRGSGPEPNVPQLPMASVADVQFIDVPLRGDEREGWLAVMEGTEIPFDIRRVFAVSPFGQARRGRHAHVRCAQVLVCLRGHCTVFCEDGRERKAFLLDTPSRGLLVPPMIWAEQEYGDTGTVLLVLCDREYEEHDYIRDYEAFRKARAPLASDVQPPAA